MRRLVPALLCAALVLAVVPVAQAGTEGKFLARCGYSHSRQDDPIVRPGKPGQSHLHDFLGNATTTAFSTYGSMTGSPASLEAYRRFLAAAGRGLAAGGGLPGVPTQCAPGSGDTASYWTPALYRNGVKVDPAGAGTRQQIYYDRSNLASGTRVEVIPADLRVKTGLSTARTMAENPEVGREIYWGCSDNSTKGKATVPPAHCPTGIITLHVGFPNCWDGVLTHVDDTAHLAYPKGGRCLAPFGHPLPRVILRWEYPVGRDTGLVTLASGSLTTIHGDFWNTWQQPSLARLVDGCINAGRDCGRT
jgi:hypothetical protein